MSPPPAVATGGSGEPTVPAWLRGLPRAPEYRPTESEFADPIAFLSRVEREAAAYGICKVIPPYPRPSRRFVFAHLNRSLLSGSPWNLQAIARAPGSLTRFMPDDVPGVTSPMVYIGMLFSWFAWHVEDHELHSLNFLHTGAPKTWYAVPGDRASELEEVIRVHGYGGNPDRLASLAVLGEKTTLMSPDVLVARGVPCCRLVQYPGEFVVTFPRAYHIGFSHGFNCGEAANFATPQWLKFAKEAAVRRAVMNYLPMLSHQQLLYLLAVSFITRTPNVLSGIRSRLRDRKKEERELLVKQEFLQDMISENKLLCSFLEKKSIRHVVLWEPDLLPSSTALHSCSSGSKAPEKKSEDGCRIESSERGTKDNSSDGSAHMIGAQTKFMSGNSKSSGTASASMDEVNADTDDEDDLPFDLSIDSGSLTCVACGILGYPFMAILQPSREVLEGISLAHTSRYKMSSEKDNCSNTIPCCPTDSKFGCSFVPSRPSWPAEQQCLATPLGQANISHQNVNSHKDVCLRENEPNGPVPQCNNISHSCRSENTLHSCSDRGKSENKISEDSLGPEVGEQTGKYVINAQAAESSDGTINWNTYCTFARPRIFCLQHALEIEKLLEGKGGVHGLIICHSDFVKLKALAISVAEEIEFQFDCTDISLAKASKSDLHLINISIDDEGHEEDGRDWTSQMGLNLKYSAKLRKEKSENQEQSPLPFGGLLSCPSPVSVVPNLKWLCKRARTPYTVIGTMRGSSATATAAELKPGVKTEIFTNGNVCEDDNRHHSFRQTGLEQPGGLQDCDKPSCSEENGHGRHCLVNIPIAVAEYPMMHQVREGPVSVSTCNDSICLSGSLDLPPHASPVEVTRYLGCIQSTELSSLPAFSVQHFFNDESTSVEGSIDCVSNGCLESQDDILGSRDERLQVQQYQEKMGLRNNPNMKSVDSHLIEGLAVSEGKHGETVAAFLENKERCAKTSYCSNTETKTTKSAIDNRLETHHLGTGPVKLNSSFNEMHSADRQCSLVFGCLDSADVPASTQALSVSPVLMSDEQQVDDAHSAVKAIEHLGNNLANIKHKSLHMDVLMLEDAQVASMAAVPGHEGESVEAGSNSFDILLGALAEESKAADAPGKDEVGKASLTLITLASNEPSVTEGRVVDVVETDTILGAGKDDKQLDQPHGFHLSDLVSRCIGSSNRSDIICYVRRKHKRKRDYSCFVRSPCESLRPRSKPAVVEESEWSRTAEASFAKRGKRTQAVGSFQCDIDLCDMAFETRAELNAHKRNICTDESCGKRFSSHKYLKRHQCVHSEMRPFKCPWEGCKMTFKWLWAQTEHVRVHTGERPYKCSAPDCGQTFRYVSDYSRHRKKFNHY
ncbi:putative lysine-specific demethylase ELF6 [Zea mays]|uniref:Putative lysine-specific demethylase ELF6 n=1 Tax=Zea mays TaxID=4577 RepID=A0A1D6PJX3_MAIZE|nr:putative lysine-specific demethylase ELF6 [Zea mays]